MRHADATALWREAICDSLWGRRGIVKAVSMWLPLAVFLALSPPHEMGLSTLTSFQSLVAVACWILASVLVNDLADRQADGAAGKQRWVQRLSVGAGAAVVAALSGGGAVVLAFHSNAAGALAAYGGALAVALSYSVRPVRLKERGLCGLLAYSGAAALAYVVLPWALLGPGWRVLVVVGPAVLLDKWVNLHFHQVLDCDADRSASSRTYAVRIGQERARQTLRWAARLASASMLVVLASLAIGQSGWGLAPAAAGGGAAVTAGLYAWIARRRGARPPALVATLPCHYLGLTYGLFHIVPPVLLARLAVHEPALWWPAGAAALWAVIGSWHALRYRYE